MAMSIRLLSMKSYRETVKQAMTARLQAVAANDLDYNTPLFIWGPPAIGKSKIVEAICKDSWLIQEQKDKVDVELLKTLRPWDAANWSFFTEEQVKTLSKIKTGCILMDVRLSQVDPVEIKGAPFYDLKNQKAGFIRFNSILPDPKCPYPVYLLLDEFPLAPDLVQSAGYQLINDRKVGDYRLPDNCVVLAAGNRPEDGGVHFEMSPALESRFDHIGLDIDYKGFIKYMSKKGYDETLTAFLQYSEGSDKQTLYKLLPGQGNFPTFRSWEKAARKIKYGYKEYDAIADSVGQAGAAKFETFKELTKDIPEPEVLVKKKIYYEEVALQLVAGQKVGNQIIQKDTFDKMDADKVFEYFSYFTNMTNPKDKTDNRQELSILFLVNIKDEMEILEKIDKGFKKALKVGKVTLEKTKAGIAIDNIFTFIFDKFELLNEVDM
jgi:hypothetical protein